MHTYIMCVCGRVRVYHIQHVIKIYGRSYMADWREKNNRCQILSAVPHRVITSTEFNIVQWDFIAHTMNKMGFRPKLVQAIYWVYKDSLAQCILANHLSTSWTLGRKKEIERERVSMNKCTYICCLRMTTHYLQ